MIFLLRHLGVMFSNYLTSGVVGLFGLMNPMKVTMTRGQERLIKSSFRLMTMFICLRLKKNGQIAMAEVSMKMNNGSFMRSVLQVHSLGIVLNGM